VVRGGFGRKVIYKIVSDTSRMKNAPVQVCAKPAFVGWRSTESRRISSYNNFLPTVITLENALN
jgi:predicted DNA-binding transcriptional regulator AlpA